MASSSVPSYCLSFHDRPCLSLVYCTASKVKDQWRPSDRPLNRLVGQHRACAKPPVLLDTAVATNLLPSELSWSLHPARILKCCRRCLNQRIDRWPRNLLRICHSHCASCAPQLLLQRPPDHSPQEPLLLVAEDRRAAGFGLRLRGFALLGVPLLPARHLVSPVRVSAKATVVAGWERASM